MQLDQAKVETPRLLYFRLDYCGSDEEVKALTLVAIGAAESFFVYFFSGKKSKSQCPARGQDSLGRKCLTIYLFRKNFNGSGVEGRQ